MIILDKPYVSEFLKETIRKSGYPAYAAASKEDLNLDDTPTLSENEILKILNGDDFPKIYSNSENSIDWINKNLSESRLPDIIDLFKDKIRFRQHLEKIYPNFFFSAVKKENLRDVDPASLPFPVILKPAVGFFSMGVYKISNKAEWGSAVNSIISECETVNELYPHTVLNTEIFIVEKFVDGTEYAFDAYFDEYGKPVILNIFKHLFSGEDDVGDRVYLSSKEIIENNLARFTKFLTDLGKRAELKNFPLHSEVRITKDNSLFPIEINPMRFGGWCTTADATYFFYDINPIDYFFNRQVPDWSNILRGRENKLYSLIVLNNSTGLRPDKIKSFDYDKLLSNFQNPLELRRMNIKKSNVFGFLFCETDKSNFYEIEQILNSDLVEYVR